jgi:7-cyano-7-deazaguanine synthase in queuosine biosynthesis
MADLVIGAPRLEAEAGRLKASSRIRMPSGEAELWFRGPEDVMAVHGGDAFLITLLTTAMRRGLRVIVEAEVSPKLLGAIGRIQDVLCCWYPDCRRVAVEFERVGAPAAAMAGVASFFSGGVDSLFTAYRHPGEIGALVFVHGFDIPLENLSLRERVSRALRDAARLMDKRLVEIETNSRQITNRHAEWTYYQFGPALASVAALLGGAARMVLVPASESYAHLEPCASHPLLDPLWSTESVEVVYDGGEATRNQKVELIARHPEILPMLRVCWENLDNAYNCGRCEKCLRTMIHLQAANALDRCPAFAAPLTAEAVAAMRIPNDLVFFHAQENLRQLEADDSNADLVRALRRAIVRYEAEQAVAWLAAFPVRQLPAVGRVMAGKVWRRLVGHLDA